MSFFRSKKKKIFVIGSNKTGTTSLGTALNNLGYRLGNQLEAEMLIDDWAKRDFRRLIKYCHSADAFQDIPFSLAYTFQAMDAAFPGSKFILSVRDNADQWYRSLTRFHMKRRGLERLPTVDEMRSDPYVWPGYVLHAFQLMFEVEGNSVWDECRLKKHYSNHIQTVRSYFRHRSKDLLEINLSETDSMERLCRFIEIPVSGESMPKLNSSC